MSEQVRGASSARSGHSVTCWRSQTHAVCTGCSTAANDLVYVLDGSWSVGVSDFDTAKQWLINISSQFDISPHYTQVS